VEQDTNPFDFRIDGENIRDRGRLQYDSHVASEGFSFNLEPV
jgi:hypothetical protein